MGYTTNFEGQFKLDGELTAKQLKQLEKFCDGVHEYDDNGCPGGYCQWVVSEEGDAIEWDCGEKFNDYVAWLQYLIVHFFDPWGIKLNGDVEYDGEGFGDNGIIRVVDSVIEVIESSSISEVQELKNRIAELEKEVRELKAGK